jgi:hypothetical protein
MRTTGQGQIILLFSKTCRNERFTVKELSCGKLRRHMLIPLFHDSYEQFPDVHYVRCWAESDSYKLSSNLGLVEPMAVRQPQFQPVHSSIYLMTKMLDYDIAAAVRLRGRRYVSLTFTCHVSEQPWSCGDCNVTSNPVPSSAKGHKHGCSGYVAAESTFLRSDKGPPRSKCDMGCARKPRSDTCKRRICLDKSF